MNDPTKTPEAEQLRSDIAETREEVGDTVEALAEKTDVKGQAKAKVAEVRDKVTSATPDQALDAITDRAKARPGPTAAAGALLVGIAIGWVFGKK